MKGSLLIFLVLNAIYSYSQNIEEIKIPQGVVYNYCDNEIIENTKKLIAESLKDSSNYLLMQDKLIVGPVLWSRFKFNDNLQKIEKGKVVLYVDDLQLEGKMSQELNDSKIIWNELRKEIKGNYILRKAKEDELKYYWSVISFDIDEPLLILETDDRKYILNFLKNDLKLFWLDEVPQKKGTYYNPIENTTYETSGEFKTYQNGEEINSVSKGQKETKLETLILLSSEEEFEKNSSLEDLTSIINKTNFIFEDLFKNSDKSGKIMIQFELKKKKNEIQFAVRDDLDLEIMKEFEKRVNNEKYPNSKKDPVKLQLIYKVNSYNDTQ